MTVPSSVLAPKVTPLPLSQVRRQLSEDFCSWCAIGGQQAECTTVYIKNRSPHGILGEKTPEEVFTRKKPAVDQMRIFGTSVYIHVPKGKRAKLEPFGKKGIFVGYSDNSKAYHIYVPGQRYIEVSRDVIFHEESTFCKIEDLSKEDEAPPLEFLDSEI